MPESGNAAQTAVIAEQIVDTAITRFTAQHPEFRRAEIPSPLKWAGSIVAALFTMGIGGMAVWLVSTVNTMQVTLARMDERMAGQDRGVISQFDELNRRVTKLEAAASKTGATE